MKLIPNTFLIALLICIFLPMANAAVVTVTEYPSGANDLEYTSYISVPHPSATAALSAYYFTFQPEFNDSLLKEVDVWLRKNAAPSGFMRCELFLTTGIYGNTAVPTGNAVATSTTDLQVSTIGGTQCYATWAFNQTYTLYAGTTYAVTIWEVNETTWDTSNTIIYELDTVGSYGGNCGYYANSGWTSLGTQKDACFIVYGEGGEAVTYYGGNYYVTQDVTNTTVELSATAEFNNTAVTAGDVSAGAVTAGDVTAGDITASGGVTVSSVTASFNNTSVTANAANATIENVTVESSLDNATLTLEGEIGGGESIDYTFLGFVFILVILNIVLCGFKVPIMGFIVGIVGICTTAVIGSSSTGLPYYPLPAVLLGFTSVVAIFVSGLRFRRGD